MSSSKRWLSELLVSTLTCLTALTVCLIPTQPSPTHAAKRNRAQLASIVTGKIAFASDRDGNLEIYSMDGDGGGQIRLTENAAEDFSPSWSPDGTRLAFVSTRDGNSEINLMNRDGTGQTRLTNSPLNDLHPRWAPDGSRIAFVTDRNGNDEIYLMNVDGTNQINVTNNPAEDSSFAFSPDGQVLALSSNREDSQFDIFKVSLSGVVLARLTTSPADDTNPNWSSQQITFQSNRDDDEEIYSMAADGSNQLRLTTQEGVDVDPSQTPAGTIVFSSSRDDNLELYAINGTNLSRLTSNAAADVQPAVQSGAIIPPPPPPGTAVLQFSAADFTIDEGGLFATLSVTRTGNLAISSTVEFATVNGTAVNRADYTANFGTLTFASGEATKSFRVLITDDAYVENDETITATLSKPAGAALGNISTATLLILDNDTALPTVNPINNARFFVNQHYYDFLNRVPDQGGIDYWSDQITRCGSNPNCLFQRRNEVSAAFFIETEFQVTGYFVYRIHQASFGALPARQAFIMDRARVALGPTLEADKLALANDFVMRDAFITRYPTSFTPEEFVNKLFDTAGLVPFAAERQRFIQDMRNGKTRAQVLIEVIEIPEYRAREFNPAFVLMQYFGYLGRDPDPGGFEFWLDVLNNRNPNHYAGLVCAFITSTEYQLRFSPVVTANNGQCSIIQ